MMGTLRMKRILIFKLLMKFSCSEFAYQLPWLMLVYFAQRFCTHLISVTEVFSSHILGLCNDAYNIIKNPSRSLIVEASPTETQVSFLLDQKKIYLSLKIVFLMLKTIAF